MRIYHSVSGQIPTFVNQAPLPELLSKVDFTQGYFFFQGPIFVPYLACLRRANGDKSTIFYMRVKMLGIYILRGEGREMQFAAAARRAINFFLQR